MPAPAQEVAGSDVMYEPATDDAVFLDIPSLTVLERTSSLNYVIYGIENDPKCTKHTWAVPGQVQ